jgi:hypothetical protein
LASDVKLPRLLKLFLIAQTREGEIKEMREEKKYVFADIKRHEVEQM